MEKEFIKQIIDTLKGKIQNEKNDDIIEELFDKRSENIHIAISQNKEYRKYMDKISKIDEEIEGKFDNPREVAEIIERHENIAYESSYICEKLMYKHGLVDGMLLILEGTKQIDITKFLKDNE